MQIFVFFALLIAVLAVVFALQNTAPATVSVLFWSFRGSLALILLGALIAGALISFFASLPTLARSKWAQRGQRKKLAALEASLAAQQTRIEELERQQAAQAAQVPELPAQAIAAPPDEGGAVKP